MLCNFATIIYYPQEKKKKKANYTEEVQWDPLAI